MFTPYCLYEIFNLFEIVEVIYYLDVLYNI